MKRLTHNLLAAIVIFLAHHHIAFAAIGDHRNLPATLQNQVPPNVLINLSIETPMQGAAYNDQNDTASGGSCDGRNTESYDLNGNGSIQGSEEHSIGDCFFETRKYLGYFDPEKCYEYTSSSGGYFRPIGATDTGTYYCQAVNGWSGNMLNWASMTAIDEFRWVMTGGNRVYDSAGTVGSAGVTRLQRAHIHLAQIGHSWFPLKKLTDSTVISRNTPSSLGVMYLYSHDTSIRTGSTLESIVTNSATATYNAIVKVCDPAFDLEENCRSYANGTYKPEGLIQQNSERMRFALISYLNDPSHSRDGGVMRANMKYTGPQSPQATGGLSDNENKEWDGTTGVQLDITDPDFLAGGAPSNTIAAGGGSVDPDIGYSGIINYINKFGAAGYKQYDPVSELFYESLNYFRRMGPTSDYVSSLTAAFKDNFPVLNGNSYSSSAITGNFNWIDPITESCQTNYIVAINDANPWEDKSLPGTSWNSATFVPTSGPLAGTTVTLGGADYGSPRTDSEIHVTNLTNTIGGPGFEGLNNTSICIGGDADTWDDSRNTKPIGGLGTVMGTCPSVGKENSYYVAGLAYWANTNDIRPAGSRNVDGTQTVKTFMVDTQEYNANPLVGNVNMLWLAAKYGGFIDLDENDNPNNNADYANTNIEWDRYDDNGNETPDGEPDNYVLASSPEKLRDGLLRHFGNINQQLSAGAAAAVISNTTDRIGLQIQALYLPETVVEQDSSDRSVRWVGYLYALFRDDQGRLREDGNGTAEANGVLDDVATDPVVVMVAQDLGTQKVTRLFRCVTEPCNDVLQFTEHDLSELRPVWRADQQLRDLNNTGIENQRDYEDAFDTSDGQSRHILTWLGTGTTVDPDDFVPFITSNFQGNDRYWLNMEDDSDNTGDDVANQADADNLVNFIRGKDSTNITTINTRARAPSGDPADGVERLGDIIHSSPVAIDKPNGHYYDFYGDRSYLDFVNHWEGRRQVTYVGANDGMLHAFNGGFYNETAYSFSLSGDNSETAHPLGAELWAYVPRNLLPHLQWLARNDYPHAAYVDGNIQTFDVNIFDADDDHVNGWGTILVANMRLGGNPIAYDHDNDADAGDIMNARSAIMIFDVTNPELPPTLLAEFSDEDLGFTISRPTLAYKRIPADGTDPWDTPATNEWTLVFGSGPDQLSTATASAAKVPYLYRLDLNLTDGTIPIAAGTNPVKTSLAAGSFEGSYVGVPLAVNWNNDYQTDTVYFGLVKGDLANTTGKFMRATMQDGVMSSWALSNVIDVTDQPFFQKPAVETRGSSKWVFAGSGRFFVQGDNLTNDQHSYYGIREAFTDATYPYIPDGTTYARASDLRNVTGYEVEDTDGTLSASDGSNPLPGGVTTFSELRTLIASDPYNGWYRNFAVRTLTNGNERLTGISLLASDFVLFTTYETPLEACDVMGNGALYALYHETGTNHPTAGLKPQTNPYYPPVGTGPEAGTTKIVTEGAFAHDVIFDANSNKAYVNISNITEEGGNLEPPALSTGRKSWREIILE